MKPASFAHFDDVTVHFVEHPPSEEVVYFVRRCAKERWLPGPLTVVVETLAHQNHSGPEHEVRIMGPGETGVSQRGSDVLLAVRDAFDRFEMS